MQIHVRNTKNRMDRYTILSRRCLDILTQYWFAKGRPRGILFPNKFVGSYLAVSTPEQVMRRAVCDAGLPVKATPHSLRHSFATHLMEQGVQRQYIQAVLPGGGLTPKNKRKDNGTEFFLPVMAVSKVFRGKCMDELKHLWESGKLSFYRTAEKYRNHYTFKELLEACYNTEWIQQCKKTFNGVQSVIDYLGKYTHRIAISKQRIISMHDGTVTFSVKDYRNRNFVQLGQIENGVNEEAVHWNASLFTPSSILT